MSGKEDGNCIGGAGRAKLQTEKAQSDALISGLRHSLRLSARSLTVSEALLPAVNAPQLAWRSLSLSIPEEDEKVGGKKKNKKMLEDVKRMLEALEGGGDV